MAGSESGWTAAFRVNVSVTIEPDTNGDGFGDLTQSPPDTFLKSGPGKTVVLKGKATKAKVKITFFATPAGSTFTCKLDKNAAKPCNGTFKANLKAGKHTVTITAIDKFGNSDKTPLKVKTKVVHQG